LRKSAVGAQAFKKDSDRDRGRGKKQDFLRYTRVGKTFRGELEKKKGNIGGRKIEGRKAPLLKAWMGPKQQNSLFRVRKGELEESIG